MSAYKALSVTEFFATLTKSQKLIMTLTNSFPVLGSAITNVIATVKNGEGAVAGFKAAWSGLGSVIKAHPILAIATAVLAVATAIHTAEQKAKEAREKANQQAKETIENNKQELSSLNSLISRYKELANSDRTDSSNREAIKNVQDEITQLVGKQAENLDLVNGKLDEQLSKINEIYKTNAEESTNSYRRALNTSLEAINDNRNEWQDFQYRDVLWWNIYDERYVGADGGLWKNWSEDAKKAFDEVAKEYGQFSEETGIGVSYNSNRFGFTLPEEYDKRIEMFSKVLEIYQKYGGDYQNDEVWKHLSDYYNSLSTYVDDAQTAAKDLLNNLIDREFYSKESQDQIKAITNLDDYKKYRDELIETLNEDSDIKDAISKGLLDKEWVETQADSYLSALPEVSDYYNEWYEKFASDTAKGAEKVKQKFASGLASINEIDTTDIDSLSNPFFSEETQKDIDEFNEWIDSLTNEEKDIVIRISEDYTHSNIKSTLEALSEGGNVDLTLRPVIDSSLLADAGWDIDPNDKSTVFTNVFSNSDETKFLNFTPIIVDENGNYQGVLSPEELTKYAEEVCDGVHDDYLKLQIGAEFDDVDAAEAAAKRIHDLHNWYFLHDDPSTWGLKEFQDALAEWEVPEADKIHFSDLIADKDFKSEIKDYKENFALISDALDDLQNNSLQTSDKWELIIEKFPELAGRTGDLKEALTELQDQLKDDALATLAKELEYMDTDADKEALQGVFDTLLEFASNSSGIENVAASLSKLNSELDSLEDTYSNIKDVIENYNENGYLTLNNLQSIMDLQPEYINLLIDENGQINLNNAAYKEYVATKAKALLVDELKDLYSTVLNMKVEEAQAYANAEAYDAETRSVKDLLVATSQLYLQKAKEKDLANNTTVYTDAMSRSFNTAANYAAMVDSYINSLSTSQNEFSVSTEQATSALEAEKDALEAQKDALNDSKDALEDYKDGLSDAQSKIKDLIDLVQDYIKQMKENEMDALSDQIDALEEQKDRYSEIISQKKEAIELAKQEREEAEKLSDLQQAVAKDTLSLAVANLDDSSAGRKAQKVAKDKLIQSNKDLQDELNQQAYDKRIEALEQDEEDYSNHIDKRIEALNKEKDAIQEYLDNVRQLYEDACNMIDNDTGDLYGKLWNDYVYPYTTQTHAEFDNLWYSAQEAIQRYIGDNNSLIGVMEYLQTEIYNTDEQIGELELQIGNLETAIDNTNSMIDNTSTSIDNVSTSLDGLGTTIADYMAQLAELQAAANNIDVNPNPGGDKTKFWVTHNGKTYETGYNYNGDTEGNRLLAAAELTKQIAKDVSGFDQYGLGIVQGYLGVGTGGAKEWYVDLNGHRYTAVSKTKDNAIKQIMAQGIDPRAGYYVRDHIQHYATGTYSSVGGVAITQEHNKLEEIFGKLQNGQYTMLSEGSHVLDSQATNNLHRFADNPPEFVAQALNYSGYLGKVENAARNVVRNIDNHSSGNTEVSAPISISIQGDASQSTVKAIEKAGREIETRIIKKLVRFGNINKKPMY